ncbi:MAG: hypothetical protein LQ338_006002 [Usnochroma carphineum]|nr:MAG: hypothetical protein LQ338_007921 [Usnochroma carphineum]KAI4122100.1 MAG: hypothetical protein LQ338_006002 [Usnochroma carphineum]
MSNFTANFPTNLTPLQLHISFWDYNNDSIITPFEIYNGFRDLGFCVLYSLGGLLINLFFSYPTTLGHSWFPDPLFRIYTDSIHKAKHGSDTGIYDSDGYLRLPLFDEMFAKMDSSSVDQQRDCEGNKTQREGSLGVGDLVRLHARNRVAADPAGWSFAAMEWWTTWLLLQRDGRLWKEDLRAVYDGTLFWKIRDDRLKREGWNQGYGWKDWAGTLWHNGTWKTWEVGKTQEREPENMREL